MGGDRSVTRQHSNDDEVNGRGGCLTCRYDIGEIKTMASAQHSTLVELVESMRSQWSGIIEVLKARENRENKTTYALIAISLILAFIVIAKEFGLSEAVKVLAQVNN